LEWLKNPPYYEGMSSLIDFFTDDRDVIISYKWAWVYIIAGLLVALTILMVQWLTTPSIAEDTPSVVVRQDNAGVVCQVVR
jgi:hypothetical protein